MPTIAKDVQMQNKKLIINNRFINICGSVKGLLISLKRFHIKIDLQQTLVNVRWELNEVHEVTQVR